MKQNMMDHLFGFYIVFKKEFFMNLKSIRMVILLLLFTLFILFSVGVGSVVMNFDFSDMNGSNIQKGPVIILYFVVQLIGFIGPILGIALAFDVIVKEKIQNSLSLLLCRPVQKRTIALGKFCGITAALILPVGIVNVVALVMISVISGKHLEFSQAGIFLVLTIVFLAIYIAIAQCISSIAKTTATAILLGIGIWFTFWLFIPIITAVIPKDAAVLIHGIELLNPSTSYSLCMSASLFGGLGVIDTFFPPWVYYLVLFLFLGGFVILAMELFHRIEA
ncbi:MAG: ABC transporter permease subunit [Candidatus Thermoplasmatota archaeon]